MSSYFHSASQSCPILSANCTFRHILKLFRIFPSDRSGMDKSSSSCLLYSDVVKVEPSPTWLRKYQEEDRKRSPEKGNQGVGDSRSITFKIFVLFFISINFLYHFFLYIFHPRHLPTPPTTTHDLYLLPTISDTRFRVRTKPQTATVNL